WAETLGPPPPRALAGLAQARLRPAAAAGPRRPCLWWPWPRQAAFSPVPDNSAGSALPLARPSIVRPPTEPPGRILVPLRDDGRTYPAGLGFEHGLQRFNRAMLARLRPHGGCMGRGAAAPGGRGSRGGSSEQPRAPAIPEAPAISARGRRCAAPAIPRIASRCVAPMPYLGPRVPCAR